MTIAIIIIVILALSKIDINKLNSYDESTLRFDSNKVRLRTGVGVEKNFIRKLKKLGKYRRYDVFDRDRELKLTGVSRNDALLHTISIKRMLCENNPSYPKRKNMTDDEFESFINSREVESLVRYHRPCTIADYIYGDKEKYDVLKLIFPPEIWTYCD